MSEISLRKQLNSVGFTPTQVNLLLPLFRALRADGGGLHDAFVALTAKLDADSGVNDTNYASTLNPSAPTLKD